MRNLIGLFCIIGHSALWASDIPEDVRSFSLGEEGPTIFWHQNQIHLFEDALDENITEIEHFIPRSKIWIDSYKNKILVLKEPTL